MFTLFIQCNNVPPMTSDTSKEDEGWKRRFTQVWLGNYFMHKAVGGHYVDDADVYRLCGMYSKDINDKLTSPQWRDAMFDVFATFYRIVVAPYREGKLGGILNIPKNYKMDNDTDAMWAWAPEWRVLTESHFEVLRFAKTVRVPFLKFKQTN